MSSNEMVNGTGMALTVKVSNWEAQSGYVGFVPGRDGRTRIKALTVSGAMKLAKDGGATAVYNIGEDAGFQRLLTDARRVQKDEFSQAHLSTNGPFVLRYNRWNQFYLCSDSVAGRKNTQPKATLADLEALLSAGGAPTGGGKIVKPTTRRLVI